MPLLGEVLPRTPAGARAAWVLDRVAAVADGEDPPSPAEIAEAFAPRWLAEVPTGPWLFPDLAPMIRSTVGMTNETGRPDEARVVLELADGTFRRVRCTVEADAPHRITFLLVGPALDPTAATDRVFERDGRVVHARDYGGNGPPLLLWHGSGCDATVWEGMVPYLRSFRVVAQDLPGHGASPVPRLSVDETLGDAAVVIDALDLGDPVVVGHSLGGWLALHHAARGHSRGLVCLDGPSALTYGAMGLDPGHPGFVPDPSDVVADLDALTVPALLALCRGTTTAEADWMVPFRQELADHVEQRRGRAEVEWVDAGHMLVTTDPEPTAELVCRFGRERLA
jgi:pimeloyl-ACP methyl ester carboxylesterase